MPHIELFSQARQDLNEEVQYHPKLQEILSKSHSQDFPDLLAHIAAYCSIALDDVYTEEDMDRIANYCTERLRRKRTIILS